MVAPRVKLVEVTARASTTARRASSPKLGEKPDAELTAPPRAPAKRANAKKARADAFGGLSLETLEDRLQPHAFSSTTQAAFAAGLGEGETRAAATLLEHLDGAAKENPKLHQRLVRELNRYFEGLGPEGATLDLATEIAREDLPSLPDNAAPGYAAIQLAGALRQRYLASEDGFR